MVKDLKVICGNVLGDSIYEELVGNGKRFSEGFKKVVLYILGGKYEIDYDRFAEYLFDLSDSGNMYEYNFSDKVKRDVINLLEMLKSKVDVMRGDSFVFGLDCFVDMVKSIERFSMEDYSKFIGEGVYNIYTSDKEMLNGFYRWFEFLLLSLCEYIYMYDVDYLSVDCSDLV